MGLSHCKIAFRMLFWKRALCVENGEEEEVKKKTRNKGKR